MTNNKKNPAVAVAAELAAGREYEVVLAEGKRAVLKPVPASLIDEVTSRVKTPEVPMWNNPERVSDQYPEGRPEPNPNDPKYLAEVADTDRRRGLAAVDALCMFGVEMRDPVSKEDGWFKKLAYMQKRGMIDLSEYDLDDPLDLEFVYKRFVAMDATTLNRLTQMSVNPEEVAAIERSFQR